MPRIDKQFTVTGIGEGFPDYMQEISRGKQVWGYAPEQVESFLFALLIATEDPGCYVFTREPITVAEGWVEVPDAFTGLPGIECIAGEDYIMKEMWASFDQPIEFQMIQDQYDDVSCMAFIPAFTTGYLSGWPIGWSRGQVESITVASKTTIRIRNLGTDDTTGKIWIVGFRKMGRYAWW